jgi:hypothetical protein
MNSPLQPVIAGPEHDLGFKLATYQASFRTYPIKPVDAGLVFPAASSSKDFPYW